LHLTCLQGNIAEWKVEEGQEIAAGDVLAEVETDKATMDWESQVSLPVDQSIA
jgi:pyruvate/2-oxoglutarate dehydrogenase complex dihydrolipoamide acyltransferase (E2) component